MADQLAPAAPRPPLVRPWLLVLLGGVVAFAIWRRKDIVDTFRLITKAAHPSNIGERGGTPVDRIVIHTTAERPISGKESEWSAASAATWFAMDHAGTSVGPSSAHYIVTQAGQVITMVDEEKAALHAGHAATNRRSVGIELEGYGTNPATFTPAMLGALAELVRRIAARHRIPLDRTHIIGHNEVPDGKGGYGGASHKTDPGVFPWATFMAQLGGRA